MVDELRMVESKKVCSVNHEAPEFFRIYYDENYRYQVEHISLDETKEKLEWRKHTLEYESSYGIENRAKII